MMAESERINLVVDGTEIAAPAGAMLVDAAKHGDVEIPVFCYEPKLGPPVGACRAMDSASFPALSTFSATPMRDSCSISLSRESNSPHEDMTCVPALVGDQA